MSLENPWTVYRTRFLVHARQLTEPLLFTDALGREQSGLPGDYLVESSSGFRRITPRAIFEDVYVPLAPAPPQDAPAAGSAIERALRALNQSMARRASPPHPDNRYGSCPDRQVATWSR
jgi:hypothetical protein